MGNKNGKWQGADDLICTALPEEPGHRIPAVSTHDQQDVLFPLQKIEQLFFYIPLDKNEVGKIITPARLCKT